MALLISLDGPRRSPRIRVRRQTNLPRPSCVLTHTQTAVTPRTLSRSRGADLPLPATTSVLGPPSAACTAPSSSRTRSPSRKKPSTSAPQPQPSSPLPIRAGTKRKRPHSEPHLPCRLARPPYQLVPRPSNVDDEAQTPRQLRYAKRQRLLTSPSGKENPVLERRSVPKTDERSGTRERVLHRASTEGRLLIPQPAPQPTSPSPTDATNLPRTDTALRLQASVPADGDISDSAPAALAATTECVSDPEEAVDLQAPTFTTLYRLPLPARDRRPDTADQGIWKLACQERVEYLKDIYRDILDAVLRAEASCQQAPAADKTTGTTEPVPELQAEFKLYTPSTCAQEQLDADVDMDAGYSSDWDSDEDDDDTDDMMLDEDSDSDAPTYDALVALDGTVAATPKLPRLSTIRVYALEAVPEQTARNGVPFMGRGTPVDRQRRADWAAPARPYVPPAFFAQPWSAHSSPQPEYYSPSSEMAFQQPSMDIGMGMGMGMASVVGYGMDEGMQVDVQMPVPFGVNANVNVVPQIEHAYAHAHAPQQQQQDCLSWLDPALRADSTSPSPSPAPTSTVPLYSFPTPLPMQDFPAHTPSPDPSISSSSSSSSSSSAGSPSPTGCAWHATFLQCLQSSGCAPFFATPVLAPPIMDAYAHVPPPPVEPGMLMGTGGGMGIGMGMFPNQELAQFVRSHLVPGSVTLGRALG